MNNILTLEQLQSLKKVISAELLKRGFTAKIETFEEEEMRSGGNCLNLQSESFQTTPVLFEEIRIENFSSSVKVEQQTNSLGETYSAKLFWLQVHVSYSHFSGGTNGCSIFDVSGVFYNDETFVDYKIR